MFESGLVHEHFDLGDVPPAIELLKSDGKRLPISRLAGRTAVMHMIAQQDDRQPACEALVRDLVAREPAMAAAGAALTLVRRAPPHLNLAFRQKHRIDGEVLSDAAGALAANLAMAGRSATAIYDRGSRLLAVLPVEDAATHADRVMALLVAPEPFRSRTRPPMPTG